MQGEKGWAANNGGMDGGGRRRCFNMTDWDSGDHLRPVDERERERECEDAKEREGGIGGTHG